MVLFSLIWVRRGAREGEETLVARLVERWLPRHLQERRRAPRRVWRNPIAWREAATRASAGGRSLLRLLFIVAGLVLGVGLVIAYHSGTWGSGVLAAYGLRMWLVPLIWIEFTVILLVVTNTAATTLTREKESQTIELLLTTPLTSRYIIAGMLQGLVRLVVPLIAVPTVTLALFAAVDLVRPGRPAAIAFEAVFLAPALMLAFTALAAMIGLHFSLLSKKTVQAVMISTAVVLGSAGLLTACGVAMKQTSASVAGVVLPFTPVWGLQALVDPWTVVDQAETSWSRPAGLAAVAGATVTSFRVTRGVFTLIAAAVFLSVTFGLYNSMVRGFDMTVRRQSA
jgi:ABC-type transport system involved in multi-copper enzyme maturation permease subunit